MKNADYEKARNLLYQIESTSSQVELIKEQWSEMMDNGEGTAKLFVRVKGKTYETVLSEDTLVTTFNAILQKYRESIKKAQDELNDIIAIYTPME